MKVDIEYKNKTMEKLKHINGKNHSTAIDLYVAEDTYIKPGTYQLVKTNVAMKLPEGYKADIKPRSSTFKKFGVILTNSPGLVDTNYGGTDDVWCLALFAPMQAQDMIDVMLGYEKIISKTRPLANKQKAIKDRANVDKMFTRTIFIPKGTAIAQFEILKVMEEVEFNEVEKLVGDNRGASNLSIEKKENLDKIRDGKTNV